jgi:hypothetical protein
MRYLRLSIEDKYEFMLLSELGASIVAFFIKFQRMQNTLATVGQDFCINAVIFPLSYNMIIQPTISFPLEEERLEKTYILVGRLFSHTFVARIEGYYEI